jgi:hypothetical protein
VTEKAAKTAAARKRPATPRRLTKSQQIDCLVDLLGRVCAFLREDGYTRAIRDVRREFRQITGASFTV